MIKANDNAHQAPPTELPRVWTLYAKDLNTIATIVELSVNNMCECDFKLAFTELNRFVYSSGTTVPFHSYTIEDRDKSYDVYIFHAQVQSYGKNGLCFRVPVSVSRLMGTDSKNYLAMVQLMSFGFESAGAVHVFHRHFRIASGYDVIPVPASLIDEMDMRYWTVAVTLLDRRMLLQYDGFVYPKFLQLVDPLRVCEQIMK